MNYKVDLLLQAEEDIAKHRHSGNKQLIVKIDKLLAELTLNPRKGTGQPERLRYMAGEVWSRHIDRQHRLLYEIFEDKLVVVAISAYGHYDDK